jgi:hypothetical protein
LQLASGQFGALMFGALVQWFDESFQEPVSDALWDAYSVQFHMAVDFICVALLLLVCILAYYRHDAAGSLAAQTGKSPW